MLYITGIVIAVLLSIDLIFDFKLETIIFAMAFLISAYLADIIVQKTSLKQKKRTTSKPRLKQNSKYEPPAKHNTDNDIL